MASLFTNASAQTALQTLTKASKSLAATQNRVSTGYRINTAEDNAAYWSIATTLRSDVGALGAVKDALGLGAATIDTVYTGINDTKDLLDQIKSKLVAASQTGVPRAQVQAEITQLQNRLADVSKSTVINSETWLTQDSSVEGYNNIKDVVGSFTRAAGVISIETIQIDISQTKLYENSSAAKTARDTALATANTAYTQVFTDHGFALGEAAWNSAVEGTSTALLGAAPYLAATTDPATDDAAGVDAWKAAVAAATVTTPTDAQLETAFAAAAGFGPTVGANLWDALSDETKTAIKDGVAAAIGNFKTAAAAVASAAGGQAAGAAVIGNFEDAVEAVFTGVLGFSTRDSLTADVAKKARDAFEHTAATTAANNTFGIFDKVRTVVSDKDGTNVKQVSVSNIDISALTDTDFDKGVLSAYLTAVDDALQELTLSASVVGAAKARVEGNKTFVQNLIDANNRGIGQLVDADLNEESSKLKALQVQEQLAIQALSIANNSTQNILSLFQ